MKTKGFLGIIRKMKETYRMWRIIRYVSKKQLDFILWDSRNDEVRADNTGEVLPGYIKELHQIIVQNRDPRMHRSIITTHFGTDEYFKGNPKKLPSNLGSEHPDKKEQQKVFQNSIADAQLRISSCISANFLDRDEGDENLLYLTLKGKKFASVYGLLKEWMVEDIGQLWSVFATAIVVIGAIKFNWIVGLFEQIIQLFKQR